VREPLVLVLSVPELDVTLGSAFVAGSIWFDSTGGQTYIAYDDGNSQQFVTASNFTGLANAATKTDIASALNNVGRNLIHNSAFTIAQRGAGPFTNDSTYALDRWAISKSLDTVSFTQVVLNDAQRAAIGDEAAATCLMNVFTGNVGAGAYSFLTQSIESVRRLGGKTVGKGKGK
jgi:hypothetical protein